MGFCTTLVNIEYPKCSLQFVFNAELLHPSNLMIRIEYLRVLVFSEKSSK